MKHDIISEILSKMEPYLSREQNFTLSKVLKNVFSNLEISSRNDFIIDFENSDLLELFLSAKKVEGCSKNTINYYKSTIEKMLLTVDKNIENIQTNDLRNYLSYYYELNDLSKTTLDNIRRIFSSFFSWLENEDYILKNPVKRIHRIKTGRVVRETLSDEDFEKLCDNCDNIRDLAIVELLISTGMRVGELVKLNINDINFEEKGMYCIW